LYLYLKSLMSKFIITLKKGKEGSLLRKHPWVFSGAIQSIPKNLQDGDVTEIQTFDKKYLATGHYQSGGSISVRVLSFENEEIDQTFWNHRIQIAVHYRSQINLPNSSTNTYRLIHGEGDGLPGLVVDIYHNIAVIQCHSIGMYKDADSISKAIQYALPDLDTIFVRSKDTLPEAFANTIEDHCILGNESETIVSENNVRFKINVLTGQKTGFFLDQRENRLLVSKYAKDKSVLNCFCYTGGFSLLALQGEAKVVDSVDISQKAVDLMDENISLNSFSGTHQSICANVMHFLNDTDLPQYDIVIVDPPAFAKSLHKRHNAVQAYKRLNALAMKKVKSGGLLFTFSCSQVVGTQLFYDTIVAAGIESGKSIRVIQSLSQGPDHPIQLFHPEGHYLKGLMLYVE
jgi:23S rRNA (cytosine1962-C5)-methyltransferase